MTPDDVALHQVVAATMLSRVRAAFGATLVLALLVDARAWATPGYAEAQRAFVDACGHDIVSESERCEPLTPDRATHWEEAGSRYESAVNAAPDDPQAPAALMRAAFSFRHLGDWARTAKTYERVIADYGNEQALSKLQASDATRYAERIALLVRAYDAQAMTYYDSFAFAQAARIWEGGLAATRLPATMRRACATNALLLERALGRRDAMAATLKLLVTVGPTPDERAQAEYMLASFDYDRWSAVVPDSGANRAARLSATDALSAFYASNKHYAPAAKYALEAASRVARMKKTSGDATYVDWYASAHAAWVFLKNTAPDDADAPLYAAYGAEAELVPLDEEIRAKFDYDTGHHHYATMSIQDIFGIDPGTCQKLKEGQFDRDVKVAHDFDDRLGHIDTYKSAQWASAARARRGSLFDSLRTGLFYVSGAAFNVFTPQQSRVLTRMANSSSNTRLVNLASLLPPFNPPCWRQVRNNNIDAADALMVRYYVHAVAYASAYNVPNAWTSYAVGRLAYFTTVIGDGKMSAYVTATTNPTPRSHARMEYSPGMYLRMRAGIPTPLPIATIAAPRPLPP